MAEKTAVTLKEKLAAVQGAMKAPKDQENEERGFTYRSAEGILTAAKPLLAEYGLMLTLTDDLMQVGERYYVKATAQVTLCDGSGESVAVSAWAREPESNGRMDVMQITGAASSYARKYALNGLLLLDDAKDADTDEYGRQGRGEGARKERNARDARLKPEDGRRQDAAVEVKGSAAEQLVTPAMVASLKTELASVGRTEKQLVDFLGVRSMREISVASYKKVMDDMEASKARNTGKKSGGDDAV